jgi:hypothetical protein
MDSTIITAFGISLLFIYSIIQILQFYGVNVEQYGFYLIFYLFLLVSAFILPRKYSVL